MKGREKKGREGRGDEGKVTKISHISVVN